MNTNFLKLSIFALSISLFSCAKDDDSASANNQPVATLEVKTASNIFAPQSGGGPNPTSGPFAKFSFSENAIVTTDNWDIAFRGTTILVNGGAPIGIADEPTRTGMGGIAIVNGIFSDVNSIPTTFTQDAPSTYAIPTGSNNGWYSYNAATNIISPIAGKVFVVKTYNGKYAKFEILSYYKDAPANPDATSLSRYYKIKFVYQPNSTTAF